MQRKIDTVLFDLDGTLLNTYELIQQSFLATFTYFGYDHITKEDCIPFIGPTLEESFSSVAPKHKVDEMIAYYRKFNVEKHDELVTEFDGVYETVKTLHKEGFKLGVVSTKVRYTVLKGLDKIDLLQYFPVIITLDEVEHAKPHPEPLYKAMEFFQSKPEQTIMIGDSNHDIEGAKHAGTFSAGVAWSIKGREFIEKLEPDYILDNMKDLLPILGVKEYAEN